MISQEVNGRALLIARHHGRRGEACACRYDQVLEWDLMLAFEGAVDVHAVCLYTCDAGGYYSVIAVCDVFVFEYPGIRNESFLLMAGDDSEPGLQNDNQQALSQRSQNSRWQRRLSRVR